MRTVAAATAPSGLQAFIESGQAGLDGAREALAVVGDADESFGYYKNFDGCSTIGPQIVVNEISNPQDVPNETRVNGEVRQSSNTKDMIFGFAEYLSRDFTPEPGDVISAGTAAGTAMDSSEFLDGRPKPDLFLQPGDVIEVSSPLIGSITNEVLAKFAS